MSNEGVKALHWACQNCFLGIAEYLVQKCHADVNSIDCRGETPLHKASTHGNLELVQLLVEQGDADCSFGSSSYGLTALHVAALKKHAPVMLYLVEHWVIQ